jgi:hypothetical protein
MPTRVAALMPNTTAVPKTRRAEAPAPVAMASGREPKDEGERGHQDRPQAQTGALDRRLDQRLAALVFELGEFDDQDGVLGREPNEHDQADLGVDVILHAAQARPP